MNRCLLLFLFLFFGLRLSAQQSSATAFYTYHNQKDTIRFKPLKVGWPTRNDVFRVVDSVQVNNKGSKEVLFYRKSSGFRSDHGGTFDKEELTTIGKYEIWDLDAKAMLFEAVDFYSFESRNFDARQLPVRQYITKTYEYDFFMDAHGNIFISNLCVGNNLVPDLLPGKYRFINGQYTKL